MATYQAGSPLVGPNNVNAGKTSGRENVVAVAGRTSGGGNAIAVESNIRNEEAAEPNGSVNSAVRNEKIGEPNGDAKVGSEVQLIIAVMAPVSHWFITTMVVQPITTGTTPVFFRLTTATSTLDSLVAVFVCRQPAPVCGTRPPLSRVQLLSYASCAKSGALSVKLFGDTQDMSIYEGFLAADNLDE